MNPKIDFFRQAIRRAAQIREDSYDKVAADAATVEADKDFTMVGEIRVSAMVEYRIFYRVSLEEACAAGKHAPRARGLCNGKGAGYYEGGERVIEHDSLCS